MAHFPVVNIGEILYNKSKKAGITMGRLAKEIENSLNKKYCVVYGRVSTESEMQALSLKRQERGDRFERKILEDGYTLLRTFSDSESGTDFERPEFEEMLYLCGLEVIRTHIVSEMDNGNYDKRKSRMVEDFLPRNEYIKKAGPERPTRIYCASTSRFCRNIEGYKIISKLKEIGVSCYFKNENIDTADEDSGWTFKLQLMQTLDEQQSRQTSEKVREGMLDSERENKIRTNGRIYGYEFHDLRDNSLTIIPEEAEVVKLIYKLYIEDGLGVRKILTELNNRGVKTREYTTKKGKKVGGKPFCINSVKRILTNEKYFGGNAKKYDVPSVFTKTRSYSTIKDSYMIQLNDRIEPIIDFETFRKAKEIMAKKSGVEIEYDFRDFEEGKIYYKETIIHDSKKAIYRGVNKFTAKHGFIIKCGECFSTMYSDREAKYSTLKKPKEEREYINFFRCSNRKKVEIYKCSNNSRLSYEKLNDFLNEELSNMQKEIEDSNLILKHKLLNAISYLTLIDMQKDYRKKIAYLDSAIEKNKTKMEKIIIETYDDNITPLRKKTLNDVLASIEKDTEEKSIELEELLSIKSKTKRDIENLFNILSKLKVKKEYDLDDLSRYTEMIVYHKNGMINRVSKSIADIVADISEEAIYYNVYDLNAILNEVYEILDKENISYKKEYLDIDAFIEAGLRRPEECGDCPQIEEIIKEREEMEKENEEFFIEEAATMTQKEFFDKYGSDKDLKESTIKKLVFKE